MRRSPSALLSLSKLSLSKLATLILVILILSTLSFAAAPDRITGPMVSGQMVPLARSLHPRAQAQYDLGAVDPQSKFGYVTLLTSPSASQQRALDKLTADQQDPSSPNYHKWLTPAQYADRFGLSQNDIDKIKTWLKAQGFTVVSVGGGRNSIVFSGTAMQIEAAFQTQIHRYKIGGQEHFANATPVKIPAAWAGVVTGVRGLNSFHLRPMSSKKRLHPDYYDSSTQQDFVAPGDIATLYDISALYGNGIDGTGQKVAIVGQTDIYLDDINDFRQGFGLTQIPTTGSNACTVNSSGVVVSCNNATNLGYVVVGGSDPGAPNLCGDITEADLDIEWSGAIARNAQIIYVNAPATLDANCYYVNGSLSVEDALSAAINPPSGPPIAPVISMSYGACELGSNNLSDETELQQANVEGVTVLNSSGDTGAAGCDGPTNADNNLALYGPAVSYPASSQYVTGVGGTAIPYADFTSTYWGTTNGANGGSLLPPPAPRVPEEAWNDSFEFAAYCTANSGTNFCTYYGFGNPTTPLQVQETLGIAAGGGGASNCTTYTNPGVCEAGFSQPSWQTVTISGQPKARYVPDVSLLASPNWPGYIWCTPVEYLAATTQYASTTTSSCANGIATAVDGIVSGNAYVVYPSITGGTSAATPVFAGMVALLSQYLGTTDGLGNINPMLYKLAQTKSNKAFNQLISGDTGNNQVFCVPGEPSNQTLEAGLICPGSGVLGFLASNADTTTGYNLVTGLGSVDLNNLAIAWAAERTTSTTGLAAAPTSASVGQSVTLTATISPTSATGAVTFKTGSTTLGIATLSSGVAAISTTNLPVGNDTVTASYPGDGYNAPSSGTTTVNVTAPDFTLTNTGSTSATVSAGVPATGFAFSVAPAGGATTFATAVSLNCSGIDATMSCNFSLNPIPAGSGATNETLTITTSGPNTAGAVRQEHRRADNRSPWLPLSLPLAGMVLAGLAGRGLPLRYKIAGLCLVLALTGFLVACGGGSGGSSPPPPVGVSVTPSAVSLWPNYSGPPAWPSSGQAFAATVTNTTNTAVTWSISPSTAGSIDSSGNYTAPQIAAGLPTSVTIQATSQADSTKSGRATVTLKSATVPGPYTVTVNATESVTTKPLSPSFALTVQ